MANRPRDLATRLKRFIPAPPKPEPEAPPQGEWGWRPLDDEGTDSARAQRLEGVRALVEADKQQTAQRRQGDRRAGFHLTGWAANERRKSDLPPQVSSRK